MLVIVHDRGVDAPCCRLAIRRFSELFEVAWTRQRLAVGFGGVGAHELALIHVAVIVVATNHDTAPSRVFCDT